MQYAYKTQSWNREAVIDWLVLSFGGKKSEISALMLVKRREGTGKL